MNVHTHTHTHTPPSSGRHPRVPEMDRRRHLGRGTGADKPDELRLQEQHRNEEIETFDQQQRRAIFQSGESASRDHQTLNATHILLMHILLIHVSGYLIGRSIYI